MRFQLTLLSILACTLVPAQAQTVASEFAANYTLTSLGTVPGLPGYYGGLTFENGNPNVLLIGGNANAASGSVYAVNVTRDGDGHITSFGNATPVSTAPYIDGGLAYAPDGSLFYTGYSSNLIGQILPGNSTPAVVTNVTTLGVGSSVGSLAFVPEGFGGAGRLIVGSYTTKNLYTMPYSVNMDGTYTLGNTSLLLASAAGIEGIAFVKGGNPGFANDTMLICDYTNYVVTGFDLDSSGNLTGTSFNFITGLGGAEGAVIDPVTGDFLFSTYSSSSEVVRVSGFSSPNAIPEPAEYAALLGLGGLGAVWLRRRKTAAVPA